MSLRRNIGMRQTGGFLGLVCTTFAAVLAPSAKAQNTLTFDHADVVLNNGTSDPNCSCLSA